MLFYCFFLVLFLFVCLFLLFSSHRWDYLRITDGNSNTIGTYCGNQTGKSVRVVGTLAVLTFHTDGSIQRRGFELSFSFFGQSPGDFGRVSVVFTALTYFCYCTQICPEMHLIRCMPISISVIKCPVAPLVNFTITSGMKYRL